jgi:hypothetical protein
LPACNCWVEIDPFLYHGIRPRYYSVKQDLNIDTDDIVNKIDSGTKVILVTHYLGFPQQIEQIKEICYRKRIYLIEDCAHAFLSKHHDKPIGSFGDLSIFSFRITLPIPNSAALVINNQNIECDLEPTEHPNSFSTFYVLSERLKYQTSNNGGVIKIIPNLFCREVVYRAAYVFRLLLRAFRKITRSKGKYLINPRGIAFLPIYFAAASLGWNRFISYMKDGYAEAGESVLLDFGKRKKIIRELS